MITTSALDYISGIDWRAVVAVCGILGAAAALIAYQQRHSSGRAAQWLGFSALSLELLGLSLSVFWAVTAPDGAILPLVFVFGWIGMLIGRAVLIPYTVDATRAHSWSVLSLAVISMFIAYGALYGSGLFNAVNDAGNAAQARLEASKPAMALDSEIETARTRLASLAGFANADKAHAEEKAAARANRQAQEQRARLQAELSAKQAELSACPHNYITHCIKPAHAEIARIESELATLPAGETDTPYAEKYSTYTGLQQHLVELEKQRAELSESGRGIKSAWKPEDRMIAWLFGIDPETASNVKWLLFTAIFDVLSLLFRIAAAIVRPPETEEEKEKRRFFALLRGGYSVREAADISSSDIRRLAPPAQVARPHMESLDTGGRLLTEGPFNGHAGECVSNAPATAWFDSLFPGLLDSANAGAFDTALAIMKQALQQQQAPQQAGTCITCLRGNQMRGDVYRCELGCFGRHELTKGQAENMTCGDYKQWQPGQQAETPQPEKKVIGQLYPCEKCGAEYKARAQHQKYCAKCGPAKRKAYAMGKRT